MSRQLDYNAYFRTHNTIRMNEYKYKIDTQYPTHDASYETDLDVAKRMEHWMLSTIYRANPKMKLGTLTHGTYVL